MTTLFRGKESLLHTASFVRPSSRGVSSYHECKEGCRLLGVTSFLNLGVEDLADLVQLLSALPSMLTPPPFYNSDRAR